MGWSHIEHRPSGSGLLGPPRLTNAFQFPRVDRRAQLFKEFRTQVEKLKSSNPYRQCNYCSLYNISRRPEPRVIRCGQTNLVPYSSVEYRHFREMVSGQGQLGCRHTEQSRLPERLVYQSQPVQIPRYPVRSTYSGQVCLLSNSHVRNLQQSLPGPWDGRGGCLGTEQLGYRKQLGKPTYPANPKHIRVNCECPGASYINRSVMEGYELDSPTLEAVSHTSSEIAEGTTVLCTNGASGP